MAQRQSCQFPMQVGVGGLKQIDFAEKRKKIKLCAARRYFRIRLKVSNLRQRCVEVGLGNKGRHPDLKFAELAPPNE